MVGFHFLADSLWSLQINIIEYIKLEQLLKRIYFIQLFY
jgi:hypothetical protein